MLIHHFLAIVGFSSSLFVGYGLPGVCCASLMCEISGVFLNYKDLSGKLSRTSKKTFMGFQSVKQWKQFRRVLNKISV